MFIRDGGGGGKGEGREGRRRGRGGVGRGEGEGESGTTEKVFYYEFSPCKVQNRSKPPDKLTSYTLKIFAARK